MARAVPITTNRHAATNNSALRVRATLRNSGRNTKRPKATIAATASSGLANGNAERSHAADVGRWGECAEDEQYWDHRQVLEQQNREAGAAGGGVEPFLVRQHLNHDCSRRHREGQTDHPGADPVLPEKHGDTGQHRGAKHDLQGAETKY